MSSASADQRICLYDSDELDGVLDAMAGHAALLLPANRYALVGVLRRGAPLARMLQQRLARLTGTPEVPLYSLKVKRYADDLSLLHPETALTENPELAGMNLADTSLLVVDDVLYEGHSLLRTCAYLTRLGAREVRTAVLVDRCVSRQPIRADIIGIRLQVAPGDIVECNVPPYESTFRIDILRHD
ncbi:phosphoribosyltransferase family protein [Pseudomonas indica]|uniref:Pyrimidine operon attenuation protein / uracil phosphoribosyltransferase n=1 Tax=Pseudomonas indica TaxID=137658 RepID=A0A1G9BUM5_9PSED|nr:phosphoribosyltransferase family protein [Pseudomonas indica]SDK43136.1 pyrimidine operon attenuation protein / uracil phosphoribosyltransferase [Pseudomonas indica]